MPDAPLTYTLKPGLREGTEILKLDGQLTLTTMFGLQNELRGMKPPVLILDLSGSAYMDSAGLGVVLNQHVSAQRDGRKFLIAGVNHRILALMQMTRVDAVLSLFPTVEAAEDSLSD